MTSPLDWLLRYGIKVLVTDDLANYPIVANKLELNQQVCSFHAFRWMMLARKECETILGETWLSTIDKIWRIFRCWKLHSTKVKVDGRKTMPCRILQS